MFEQAGVGEPRNAFGEWMSRGAIAVFFCAVGMDKFGNSWVKFFDQVGIGQWFRYFTGIVEIAGGLLVLIPATVTLGLGLLACTMASAALILTFVLHRPQDSVFSGALLIGLVAYWWNRRN
jgi:putative oxidoreductase